MSSRARRRLSPPVRRSGSRLPRVPPAAPASYLWGNIHGWGMLVGGPVFFLLFLYVLLAPDSDRDARFGAILLMVLLALATLTGFGLVRQLKFALILVYVWAGLHLALVAVALLAMVADPKAALPALLLLGLGTVFWSVCSVYYHRRRTLFR